MKNKRYPDNGERAVLRILLLIPILGDALRVFLMDMGRVVPGLSLNIFNNRKINAIVKQDATIQDRVRWFIEGTFFFVSIWGLWNMSKSWEVVLMTSPLFVPFGIFAIVSAIYPGMQWNRRRKLLGIIIYYLFFGVLVTLIAFGYIFRHKFQP